MSTQQNQAADPESGASHKPWYKRWWAIALGVFILLGVVAQFVDTDEPSAESEPEESAAPEAEEEAEEEAEPVAVPDLVGMNLADARDTLSDLDLEAEEYDAEEDRNIFRASNWEVVEQDPSGGSEIEPESTVRLGVRHQDDGQEEDDPEETEAPPEEEETPENEETSEEEPETVDYTITLEEAFGDNGEVRIEFDLPDHFTAGLMASSAQRTAADGLEEARAEYPDADRYYVWINGEDGPASNAAFEPETLDSLDLEDPTLNVFEHLDAGSAHPELLD